MILSSRWSSSAWPNPLGNRSFSFSGLLALAELFLLSSKHLGQNPELPDKSLSTSEKNALSFEVLSDIGNQVAHQYGIVFELIPELAKAYQNGFDLHGYNGDQTNALPLAATYVIDRQGTIRYAFLDADYRNRAEPAEILEALKSL